MKKTLLTEGDRRRLIVAGVLGAAVVAAVAILSLSYSPYVGTLIPSPSPVTPPCGCPISPPPESVKLCMFYFDDTYHDCPDPTAKGEACRDQGGGCDEVTKAWKTKITKDCPEPWASDFLLCFLQECETEDTLRIIPSRPGLPIEEVKKEMHILRCSTTPRPPPPPPTPTGTPTPQSTPSSPTPTGSPTP